MAILYTKFYQNSSYGARAAARQARDTWVSVREVHGVYRGTVSARLHSAEC
jgi:hypothetical protein